MQTDVSLASCQSRLQVVREGPYVSSFFCRKPPPVPAVHGAGRCSNGGWVSACTGRAACARRRGETRRAASGLGRAVVLRPTGPDRSRDRDRGAQYGGGGAGAGG